MTIDEEKVKVIEKHFVDWNIYLTDSGLEKMFVVMDEYAINKRSELDELLMWVTQILDGWHADGTAWSDWDESIRQKVIAYRTKYTYEKPRA